VRVKDFATKNASPVYQKVRTRRKFCQISGNLPVFAILKCSKEFNCYTTNWFRDGLFDILSIKPLKRFKNHKKMYCIVLMARHVAIISVISLNNVRFVKFRQKTVLLL